MNLVGKIFTVLIFVMSLVFMSFAVAVYATHVNWKERIDNSDTSTGKKLGYKQQLQKSKDRNQELTDEKEKLEGVLETERAAKKDALTKLEETNAELKVERDALKQQHDALVTAERAAAAAVKAAHDEVARLRERVSGLTTNITTAEGERDAATKSLIQATDELHQKVNEVKRLKQQQADLAAKMADAMAVIRLHGLRPDPQFYTQAPIVDGKVTATPGGGLVEISLGEDDGMRKGHRLKVIRRGAGAATYVGEVEVLKTDPDKAVCKADPRTLKSNVQTNDYVTTRL